MTYQRQMALYWALLQQIYPSHRIEGWLIWTEDASTQEVTREMCAAALAEFGDFRENYLYEVMWALPKRQ